MPRSKGQRSGGYADRRSELLQRLRERLGLQGATRASWRELAAAAEIGLATLAHYFGKRDDIVLAVMRDNLMRGAGPIAELATPAGSFAASVQGAVQHLAAGFRHGGVGEIHAVGLAEGLRHPVLGPGFVELVLEPGIEAVRRRLAHHQSAGEMIACDLRNAAVMLISPVLVMFLHQTELGGAALAPLDVDRFLLEHGAAFVRAHINSSGEGRVRAPDGTL